MCGIVGYVGQHRVKSILLEGLKKLEYRGYDSAGLAICAKRGIKVIKKRGRVEVLAGVANRHKIDGHTGISHTRWATHGSVNDANAHPHLSADGQFAIVHNGVIENYQKIKSFLLEHGLKFKSDTDSEILANLIAFHYHKEKSANSTNRFLSSVHKSLLHVEGTYGIAVIAVDYPDQIVGARKGSPLVVGIGNGENMLASDVSAFAGRTRSVVYLNDGQIVHLSANNFSVLTNAEESVQPVIDQVNWNPEEAEIGSYAHYMEKEIFEQPEALRNAMRGRFSDDQSTAKFGGLNLVPKDLRQVDRILFCACGTAWHAGLVSEYLIEQFSRIPAETEYASEFRYRNTPIDRNTLVFAISQSGETLDTLEALREAKRKGYRSLAITNVVGSTIARESHGGIYQHAGPEIGVASTKAFTSQILLTGMMALHLGRLRDLSFSDGVAMVKAFKKAPQLVENILTQADIIKRIAEKYASAKDFLFLGRQVMFPIALEGALKLKEISYIHAEGYPAAEMKHGPIALISQQCPTVFIANQGKIFKKSLANIEEIRARNGPIIAITSAGQEFPKHLADDLIEIPNCHPCIDPILATIPLQLFAYYIAVHRGCDIDKPRNLAKSVTVE